MWLKIGLFLLMLSQMIQPAVRPEPEQKTNISLQRTNERCQFTFDGKTFTFEMNYSEPTRFSVSRNEEEIFTGVLCKPIWGRYLREAYALDVDNNGYKDVILRSYLVGASGAASTIVSYNVFLFFPQNRVRLIDVSTFQGDERSFSDLDGDGTYEFLSNKLIIKANGDRYYLKNIFSLGEEGIVNVTEGYPEYLGAFKGVSGMTKIEGLEVGREKNIFRSPVFFGDNCDKRNW